MTVLNQNSNIMESNEPDENVSSQPLKHLLSLEWDDPNDMSLTTKSVEEGDKPPKPKKKVRFSDMIEQNYLDSTDLERNVSDSESDDDYSSQYDEFIDDNEEDDFNDEEDSEGKEPSELELELDKNLSLSEDLPDGELSIVMELPSPEIDQAKNMDELNAAVEKQLHQFSGQIQNEKSKIVTDGTENKPDVTSIDILGLCDSKNEIGTLGTVTSEKKNYRRDKRNLQKQSDKINELLKNTDLTSSNALQIKQAVWEAWSTVKKWEYITNMRERKKSSENSDHITESVPRKAVAIHQPQSAMKRTNRKKKKTKLNNLNVQNQLPSKQREMSKADKEESDMAFKAWKKQKEESLKQNAIKQQSEKLQKRMSSLMNEEIKKERADSAYIEWKMKKIHITKKEKEREAWLLQKAKEADEQKQQRDKESQEIFHKWLERKYFQAENHSMISNDRPPWLPPGHS